MQAVPHEVLYKYHELGLERGESTISGLVLFVLSPPPPHTHTLISSLFLLIFNVN